MKELSSWKDLWAVFLREKFKKKLEWNAKNMSQHKWILDSKKNEKIIKKEILKKEI